MHNKFDVHINLPGLAPHVHSDGRCRMVPEKLEVIEETCVADMAMQVVTAKLEATDG